MLDKVLKHMLLLSFLSIGILGCSGGGGGSNGEPTDLYIPEDKPQTSINSFSDISVSPDFNWDSSGKISINAKILLNAQAIGPVSVNLSFYDYSAGINKVAVYKGSVDYNTSIRLNLRLPLYIQDFNLRGAYQNIFYDLNLSRKDLQNLQIIELSHNTDSAGDSL